MLCLSTSCFEVLYANNNMQTSFQMHIVFQILGICTIFTLKSDKFYLLQSELKQNNYGMWSTVCNL